MQTRAYPPVPGKDNMREQVAKQLDELKFVANSVADMTVTEEEIPDVVGATKFVEDKLATFRRGTIAEAGPYAKGEQYELTTSYSNVYSYNVQAIMAECAAEGIGIMDLINAGAVELTFKLTKLRNLFDAVGITTRVAPRELGEEDMHAEGPHMGKYKKPGYTRVVGRQPDES